MSSSTSNNGAASDVETLAALLMRHEYTITTAESCTGGLVASELTSIGGSSAYFRTGVVSYSNDAKHRLIDVPARTLADFGAVSEPVVIAMAEGARKRDDAQVSIAISGVAGPGGGTPEKPVGTVWIAWSVLDHSCHKIDAECFQLSGDRTAIRCAAVVEALRGTIARLEAVTVLNNED